jgi:hypothetical protein
MNNTWREVYTSRIYKMIMDNKDKPIKDIKKLLREANPGQYGHMKKIWGNEYMRQLKQFEATGNITAFSGKKKNISPDIQLGPGLF